MKTLIMSVATLCALVLTGNANALDAKAAEALAQKSGCLACHGKANKIIGPSYKDVADKYKGDKSAEAKLNEKMLKGGGGVWGTMPMPAMAGQVKPEDIKTIVSWVLSL
ncbi:MAG: c-type cytochrome [Pseudomonadota bacterium]